MRKSNIPLPSFLPRRRRGRLGLSFNIPLKSFKIPLTSFVFLAVLAAGAYFILSHASPARALDWPKAMSGFAKRRQLTLVNNSGATLNSGATYQLSVNTSTLNPSVRPDCADVRVVYHSSATTASELARAYALAQSASTCRDSTATTLTFPLQAAIANSGTDSNYYLYWGSPGASYTSSTALTAYNLSGATATFAAPFNGTTQALAAGSGTPTTASGAIRYSGGKSALSFDGASDYVNVPDPAGGNLDFGTVTDFSVEAWVKTSYTTDYQIVAEKRVASTGNSQYSLHLNPTTGRPEFMVKDSSGNSALVTGTTNVANGSWQHLAGVADRNGNLTLFVNGTSEGTPTSMSSIGDVNNGEPVRIGNRNDTATYYFQGLIDELRISDTARYTANFTPQTSPFVRDGNTKLLLHFDESGTMPAGSYAYDDSGNNNTGTITGAKYVGGLIGVDDSNGSVIASPAAGGINSAQAYAGHQGIFIEEGTTNKITNPSYENTTAYGTSWSASDGTENYNSATDTFTPAMAKRNGSASGPFAAGVMPQGDPNNASALADDTLSFVPDTQISGNFYKNFDTSQGSVSLWFTPEYSSSQLDGAGDHYIWYVNANYFLSYEYDNNRYNLTIGGQSMTVASTVTAGTKQLLIARWDAQNVVDTVNSNYAALTIDSATTYGITTQPTASAPAAAIYVGSDGTTGGASGIMEGLTVFRRVLYDGTYGINVGNGNEVTLIYNSGTGQDPTLVTGSWDVVFALPTNATAGSLASPTATGEAWSHPHSSNVLTDGFMQTTYGSSGWTTSGSPSSAPEDLATGEKIFAWGYKWTSDAADEGITQTKSSLTAGQNYVVRAVADSTTADNVKLVIHDETNNADITSYSFGASSTRTAPGIGLITFELPTVARNGVVADCTSISLKILSSAASQTIHLHQVELLANLIDNPSLETGTGNPWIPSGHTNSNFPADTLIQNLAIKNSGNSSLEINSPYSSIYGTAGKAVPTVAIGDFVSFGFWGKTVSGYPNVGVWGWVGNHGYDVFGARWTPPSDFGFTKKVVKPLYSTAWTFGTYMQSYGYLDDIYAFKPNAVSLTVTPATEANSTETSGLRVDGKDALSQPITALSSTAGEINFKITPRHSYANAALFGNTSPVIAAWYGDANDYIKLVRFSSTVLRVESQFNGTAVNSDTSVAPTLDAGTTYTIKITYAAGGTQKLYIDSVEKASASVGAAVAFSTVPATTYFGADNSSANQYDLTIAAASPTAVTPASNTTAPYYKFGSKSVKLDGTSADATNYLTSIAGAATTHTLSAYVYNGTSGAVGGTVDGTVATLVFKGSVVTTTYTDMGGGWWRLTYSGTSQVAAANYGVHVQTGKIIYVDGVQLEEKAYATTYADGGLGTGYAWTSTAHESTSTRTVENLQFAAASNLTAATGSLSFWVKPQEAITSISGDQYLFDIRTDASNRIALYLDASEDDLTLNTNGTETSSVGITMAAGAWQNFVLTWDFTADQYKLYQNGSATPIISTTTSLNSPTLPTNFVLGADYAVANGFNGTVSDFRGWSAVATSAQVGDLYNAGLASHSEATTVQTQFGDGEPPVAAWSFDEGTGTTAYNNSSNSSYLSNPSYLNGTISGATWQAEDLCLSGKCLKFDGTDDLTTISGVSASNPLSVNTIGFWIKPTSVTSSGLINLTSGAYLTVASGVLSATGLTSPIYYINGRATTTPTLTLNQWTHVEVTTSTAVTADTITIGKANSLWTTGFLDEVRLYSYARSAAQVKADYNSRGALKGTAAAVGNGRDRSLQNESGAPSQGLVGYWKMDEASGTRADSSGNANTLTDNNTVTSNPGKFGNAGQFTAANSEYLSIADNASLSTGDVDFTLSAWVYLDSKSATRTIVSRWNYPSNNREYYIDYVNTTDRFRFSVSSDGTSGGANTVWANTIGSPSISTWYHVVGWHDSVNNTINISVNGGVADSTAHTTGVFDSNSQFIIGGLADGNYMDGRIEEVRMYKRVLSGAERRALYNFAPGPKVHLKMDEGAGVSAADSSGNSNTGTLNDGPTWTNGKYGKGVRLDGTNDDVSVNDFSY